MAESDVYSTELQAMLAAMQSYWRVGQTVTFTAPSIPGYQTPSPATQTFVLGAATSTYKFIYSQPISGGSAGTNQGGQLLNTGQAFPAISLAASSIIVLSLFIFRLNPKRS